MALKTFGAAVVQDDASSLLVKEDWRHWGLWGKNVQG